jgi:hypothetical protein
VPEPEVLWKVRQRENLERSAIRDFVEGARAGDGDLFRGDSMYNRRRRTCGLAWTESIEVARQYAEQGFCRTCEGGSILLETTAPPEAIICATAMFGDRYAEQEYVVDRRRLTGVKVV